MKITFIKICLPPSFHSADTKIAAIRAIREVTGMSLKEAVDVIKIGGEQTLRVSSKFNAHTDEYMERVLKELDSAGVTVKGSLLLHNIIENLRNLSIEATRLEADELANDIMQVVLLHKLRIE